jgi:eukaryotic translation initiation factor 2C
MLFTLVAIKTAGTPQRIRKAAITSVSKEGASKLTFEKDGKPMTVANYFLSAGMRLQYPDLICVEVGKGAMVPIELCSGAFILFVLV